LTGNSSNNVLDGGAGVDTVDYSSTSHGIVVNLSQHLATGGDIAADQLLNIENVVGGSGSDSLTGDAGANVLDGGAGADTMTGGAGDDAYYVDSAGDVVVENMGDGIDTVFASLNYVLGGNVENLSLLTGALNGFGNELGNIIRARSDGDSLFGLDGADAL